MLLRPLASHAAQIVPAARIPCWLNLRVFSLDDPDMGDSTSEELDVIDAIRVLTCSPDDLVLAPDYKDVVYAALLEFEHAWRGDRWWTPAGTFRTLGELRHLQELLTKKDATL